ncbi:MAG TPA: hypothetical protein VND21_00880, partial [Planctomycetota bacterium]|nr:hypothetical protein [Planctomycetota bacterium]
MTADRPLSPARAPRGIAILSVITVLVALLLIAIPFVISQKLGRDRTEATAARNRAVYEADLVCRAVISFLHRTHPAYELRRKASGGSGAEADDTVDTPDESSPDPSYRKVIADLMARAPGSPAPSISDPRSSIWSWKVVDTAALVNCNGGSPWLVANLLGAANLAEKLDAGATTIPLEGIAPARDTGLRAFRKEGGFARIGNEVVRYTSFEDGALKGCQRGVLREGASLGENGPAQEHAKAERVVDYAAWKIATHLLAAQSGKLTPFENLEDLKSVHRWGGGGVLEAARLESVAPFLTVWGRRETVETFLDGQLIVNALPAPASDATGEEIRVRDRSNLGGSTAYFGPGTLVRITDGLQSDYGMVLYPSDSKGGQFGSMLTLASRLPAGREYEGGRARIEPLGPWPVNVNTAGREVLAAVLTGLRMRGVDDPKLMITPELAWDLATKIVATRAGPMQTPGGDDDRRKSGPFRHVRDVGQWLEDLQGSGTLSERQAEAVLRNVVNPHDNELEYGTAPFCFRTMDVYLVEGRAIVNDAAGRRAGEAAIRQVVEIGADEATTWTLDSQADLDRGLALGSGGKFVETYPNNVAYVDDANAWVQPRKRAPQMLARKIWPSDERSEDVGDIRLQPARVRMHQKPTLEDHFDYSIYTDGWFTSESGPFVQPVTKTLRGSGPEDTWIHPFTVAFWMQPHSDGEWYAFDTGKYER